MKENEAENVKDRLKNQENVKGKEISLHLHLHHHPNQVMAEIAVVVENEKENVIELETTGIKINFGGR